MEPRPVMGEEQLEQTPDVADKLQAMQDEKKIAAKVLSEKKAYEASTQTWRKEIQEIWKAMNGELSASVYPWDNPQFIPKMRTEVSFVVPFIFSGDPEMEVTLVGDEDRELSFILDKMLSYRIEKNPKFYNVALAWVTQGCGLGTSMMKIGWRIYQAPNGGIVEGPVYSVPNILDIYQHALIYETSDQPSVIEKIPRTLADVKKDEKYNENRLTVTATKKTGKTPYGSDIMDKTDLNDVDSLDDEFEMVDVYERWTNDDITTIVEGGAGAVTLRKETNPYGFIPYSKFIFETEIIPNRCNGKGIGQNTLGLQEMHYDLFNLVMLNLKIVVNNMWRIDPGSRINPSDLIARPGGTVRATKEEAEQVQQSDLKQSGFEMLNLISNEHQRASGATDLIQGSPGARTLGQDQLAQSNSSNRFELVRRRLKSALSELAWMTLKMELQNLQSVESEIMKIFPVTERQGIFEMLMNIKDKVRFDVKIQGDTVLSTNKDILSKQMLDLYNLIAEVLNPEEKRHFAQEIARMRGATNVKDLIPDLQAMHPGMDPNGNPLPPMQPGMQEGGPIDGNALPENVVANQEGINESTYGFEQPQV